MKRKMKFKKDSFNWKSLFVESKVSKPIYYVVSGSDLYGWSSKDSDIDLRGAHCEELTSIIGLSGYHEVREKSLNDLDFVSFDVKKEANLIMANNSNVLEHIAATPVYKSKAYPKLKELAEKSLSKLVAKPYYGMAIYNLQKYLRSFNESYREAPVKKYLYVLRAYMAGVYALERGRIEPNINKLNGMRMFRLPIVDELVKLKKAGNEKDFINGNPEAEEAINFLAKRFKEAEETSILPPTPNTYTELNEYLIKIRLGEKLERPQNT